MKEFCEHFYLLYGELALWGGGGIKFPLTERFEVFKGAFSPTFKVALGEGFAIFQMSLRQRKSHLSEGAPQSHHSLTPYLHLQIRH